MIPWYRWPSDEHVARSNIRMRVELSDRVFGGPVLIEGRGVEVGGEQFDCDEGDVVRI